MQFLEAVILGYVFYIGCTWIMNFLIPLIAPGYTNANDASIAGLSRNGYFLMAIGTVVLVPPVEECLYRGLLFGLMLRRSRPAAYLVSVPVFCLIHVMGYVGSVPAGVLLLSFAQYIPAGVLLALAYERADSIFTPILIHTAVNALGMIAAR